MARIAFLGAAALLWVGSLSAGEIDFNLQQRLDKAAEHEVVSALVYLMDRVDPLALNAQLNGQNVNMRTRHEVVVRALQEKAQNTQGDLIQYLEDLLNQGRINDYEAFWISNVLRVDAVAPEIEALARRDDVERIYFNHPIEGIRPVEPAEGEAVRQATGAGPEPGLVAIRAPEVWELGITGDGVLVSTLDTGTDGNHEALVSRWRGLDPAYTGHPEWAFFDPVTNQTFPFDSGSHGTHTMGTVCGGPPGQQVGVAPGAQWITSAVIDRVSIAQTVADAILAFQWSIDPDGDPETNFDVPATSSNSWGLADFHGYPDCDQTFWEFLDSCEAAGIVIIFAAGNEGTSGLRRPADRATDDYRTFSVAAVDGNNPSFPIAGFSSQGPTFCTPGGGAAIKPDIAAPGVNVISSTPGGNYGPNSGTSMATPHINGVVALLRQANPELTVDQIKQIIYDTAMDLGPAGEDNTFGWGIVDAFEAVQNALSLVNLTFEFPEGRPDFLDPNGGTEIPVNVSGQSQTPQPGSGLIYLSTGGPYTPVPMVENAPNEYVAVFPPFDCGATVNYYFSAETTEGDEVFNPFTAPDASYSGVAYSGVATFFSDDFESDMGWTVTDDPGLLTGTWEKGVPLGGGDRGDPTQDADGSGQCYVTGIADGDNDIDGGATVLSSPIMDASDPESILSYYRWYSNNSGGAPESDIFVVEVSDDGGNTWVNLETVGPSGPEVGGGWLHKEFLIADIAGVTNTNQLRVRFEASDFGNGSVVEAGIDGVEITKLFCEAGCPDFDGNDAVDTEDLLALLAAWGTPDADVNGDGTTDIDDLLLLLANWGPCV